MKRVFSMILLSCSIVAMAGNVPVKKRVNYNVEYFKQLQNKTLTSSQQIMWRNFGPAMSGYCDAFWIHPTNADFMYTTLDMGCGHYTDNNAERWFSYLNWDETSENGRLDGVDFSHQDPTFGLALELGGKLMVTHDQGRTFDYLESDGYPMREGGSKKSVIAVDPTNDNNWYIGAGSCWRAKFNRFSLKTPHGTHRGGTDTGYILVSKDKGKSWREVRVGFDDLEVFRIFVNPKSPNEVYSFTNNGFYKSTDGGTSFKRQGKGLPFNISRDGAMHYDEKSGKVTLFLVEQTNYYDENGTVSSKGGVFRSDDQGDTWSSITGDMALDYTQFEGNILVERGFHKTMSSWFGITSEESHKRFTHYPKSLLSSYNRVIVNPLNVDEICVSLNGAHDTSFGPVEMWKSDNGGKHWYPTMRNGAYWDKEEDKEYWASRGDGSDKIGRNTTFAHLEKEMKEDIFRCAGVRFAQYNCRGEIVVVMQQQVLRSTDGGASFKQIDDIESTPGNWIGKGCSNLPGQGLEVETGMSTPLFRAGEHGLWRLGDMGDYTEGVAVHQLSGQTKSSIDARSICAVAVNPQDTNKIYTLQFRQHRSAYLRATKDCGETWYTVNEEKSAIPYKLATRETLYQRDLLIDHEETDRMYFTVPRLGYISSYPWGYNTPPSYPSNAHGVYRSLDEGKNFELANNGLPKNSSVWSLEMDPKNSKVLYASLSGRFVDPKKRGALTGGGLYRTEDGADNWEKVEIPAEIECVNELFIDRKTGELYLSAGQANGEIKAGGVWTSVDQGKTWRKIFEMANVKGCKSSIANPNIIAVNVGMSKMSPNVNCGAYISLDGGSKWIKANYQLAQPARINDLVPDPHDQSVIWCALYGSGWWKGIIE